MITPDPRFLESVAEKSFALTLRAARSGYTTEHRGAFSEELFLAGPGHAVGSAARIYVRGDLQGF
jgi:hypothetical protein